MAKPAGIVKKTKNNGNKNYRANNEWMLGKKIGRKKQVWVWDNEELNQGHWEKV
jgi:hypothetical protein